MDNNQNSFIPSNNNFQTSPNMGQGNDIHQHDNDFLNNLANAHQNREVRPIETQNDDINELNHIIKPNQNKFIKDEIVSPETTLTSLNIESNNQIDYSRDPRVRENLEQIENQTTKKNTITITSEGKVFILIIALLLIFIFVLPTIFDYVRNIQYK